MDPLSPTKDDQRLQRAQTARQGYINWRMADLPVVYQQLMPVTYYTNDLWQGEKAIRRQFEADQEFIRSPWRRLGPVCLLLDYNGMTGAQLLQFGLEASIPTGMEDQPKPGSPFAKRPDDFSYPSEGKQQAQWQLDLRDASQKAGLNADEFATLLSSPEAMFNTAPPADLVAQFVAKKQAAMQASGLTPGEAEFAAGLQIPKRKPKPDAQPPATDDQQQPQTEGDGQ